MRPFYDDGTIQPLSVDGINYDLIDVIAHADNYKLYDFKIGNEKHQLRVLSVLYTQDVMGNANAYPQNPLIFWNIKILLNYQRNRGKLYAWFC